MGGGGGASGVAGGLSSGGVFGALGAYEADKGNRQAAAAAQNAALAQQRMAGKAYKEVAGIVNPATVQGLLTMDKSIASQEKNLARQEELISQIDPTIIEASQQALKLLRGEKSSTLAPAEQQRQQQRQTLLNTLREQLGPGAEMSTAGMQALTRFDSETNQLLASQQQQALSGLGSIAGQFNTTRPDMLRQISGLSSLAGQRAGLAFDQANSLFAARQPMLGTAGGQFTGDLMRGQYRQGMGQQMQEQAAQQQQQAIQMAGSMFAMMSDARAKEDIKELPESLYAEVPTYVFRYKGSDKWKIGVMAQDLLEKNPNHPAVTVGEDGYYRVNYAALEVK